MSAFNSLKQSINVAYNQTQTTLGQSNEAEYTIQLKAFTRPCDPVTFFPGLKGIREHYCQDGFYRYTYGEYEGYDVAKTEIQKVIDAGFTDAFIVKLDQFEQRIQKTGEFTIQLKSLKAPVNLSYFKNLKDVKELIGNDGLFKYIYGTYTNVEDARKELKRIQKLGYEDAFVVSTSKY